MVSTSTAALIETLRGINLLRADQFQQLVNDLAPTIGEPGEIAKQLVKLNWITLYQAKKLAAGRGDDLCIGNYVILDKLGEGGMGKVYKAKQVRLSRLVALKVVRPALLANELALKRFQREAKAAAQLAHPNIVRLYDADQVGERHFLAMEYVEGIDLAQLVKDDKTLPIGMACSFIRQAATGLQHAHDLEMVHRDIKPSNLLVTTPTKPGKIEPAGLVKILDMGLARANQLMGEDSGASALTQDGTVIGTPDFMSPEQAKNSSTVDGRSDLYSLGCTLYYLLTGQALFPEGNTLEKLMQHQMDQPKPVQQIRPDVPAEVAAIVHKLLAKKPADRYQSGDELAAALEQHSVWDLNHERLKSSNKLVRPPLPPRDAAGIQSTCPPTSPKTIVTLNDPFDFDHESIAAPVPPPPSLVKKKDTPHPHHTPRRRPAWPLIAAASILTLFVAVFLVARALNSPRALAKSDESSSKEEPKVVKKDPTPTPPPKKVDPEAIEYFLPTDTEIVAVLSVQELNRSKFFQESIAPLFNDVLAALRVGASFDPLQGIERAVIAIPSANPSQSVFVLQGKDLASPAFTAWLTKQPSVTTSQERINGATQPREVWHFPGKKDQPNGAEDMYGAIVSVSPTIAVLSQSKERVVDALTRAVRKTEARFEDLSIRTSLAKYPTKTPPVLWMCMGAETRFFKAGAVKKAEKAATPKEGGVSTTIVTVRLTDMLTFELDIEAKNKNQATSHWTRLAALCRILAIAGRNDSRLDRVASLIQSAAPTPLKGAAKQENPNLHQWSNTVSADKLGEWFAPFFGMDVLPGTVRD